MTRKPPTPRQLALAADIVLRYAATTELDDWELGAAEKTGNAMGIKALALQAERAQAERLSGGEAPDQSGAGRGET